MMQITISQEDDVLVVSIAGRFTAGNESLFISEIKKNAGDVFKIVLDCSQMEYIDSTGLGVIVRFLKDFTAKGGRLALADLQATPKLVFEITRAYKIFDIYDTKDLAIKSFL